MQMRRRARDRFQLLSGTQRLARRGAEALVGAKRARCRKRQHLRRCCVGARPVQVMELREVAAGAFYVDAHRWSAARAAAKLVGMQTARRTPRLRFRVCTASVRGLRRGAFLS